MSTRVDGVRRIKVDNLARVEGEGALHVRIKGRDVADVKLRIFEPPRFFEAFLRDRRLEEVPDITSRICGICPIAYQMGAAQAMEDACGAQVEEGVRQLRHLIYLGEWIESHALHVYMLHLPDFLGYEDAIRMAVDHRDAVEKGLRLKQIGNEVVSTLGGREVHPINVRVGGFYRLPSRSELKKLREGFDEARAIAVEAVKLTAGLSYPKAEYDYDFVALSRPDEYAILDGRIRSTSGIDIEIAEFLDHFEEFQVRHSTSLHARTVDGGMYLVGPMARYNLNFELLRPVAHDLAVANGLAPPCRNPFKSIAIRCVELLHACDLGVQLIDDLVMPRAPFVDVHPRAETGYGCTEAPRGICWHRYTIGEDGLVRDARIVPPTSQNQPTMERDVGNVVRDHLDLHDDELTWLCEQTIRNYDPCISCSCHFLKLDILREED